MKIQKYGKTLKNLAHFKNHLAFSLRCKNADIIPSSLMIKPPVKTRRGFAMANRMGMLFLKERIRVIVSRKQTMAGKFPSPGMQHSGQT